MPTNPILTADELAEIAARSKHRTLDQRDGELLLASHAALQTQLDAERWSQSIRAIMEDPRDVEIERLKADLDECVGERENLRAGWKADYDQVPQLRAQLATAEATIEEDTETVLDMKRRASEAMQMYRDVKQRIDSMNRQLAHERAARKAAEGQVEAMRAAMMIALEHTFDIDQEDLVMSNVPQIIWDRYRIADILQAALAALTPTATGNNVGVSLREVHRES